MREHEPKSPKDIFQERILEVLEENNALCMDVQEERERLAKILTEAFWIENGSVDFGPNINRN